MSRSEPDKISVQSHSQSRPAAVRTITLRIASEWVVTIPYATSLVRYGTELTVGRIMIVRTRAAVRSLGPLSKVLKKGIQPTVSLSQLAIGRMAGIKRKMPHSKPQ